MDILLVVHGMPHPPTHSFACMGYRLAVRPKRVVMDLKSGKALVEGAERRTESF